MNVLFTQISALTALFVFINQMWTFASFEKSILLALGSGLLVYLVLVVGDFAIRAILEFKPREVHESERAGVKKKSKAEQESAVGHRA